MVMRGSKKFCQRVQLNFKNVCVWVFWVFFFSLRGRDININHLKGVSLAADDGVFGPCNDPTLRAELVDL